MKPAPFEFTAPDTLSEVLEVISKYGYEAKLIAGGQSLVPAMNFRLVQPTMLVDLNKLTELNYIRNAPSGGLLIGSLTRHSQLEKSDQIKAKAPLIYEAMPHIAHTQIRNRGTIGGSLAHADPAAELPVLMVALGCRIHVRSRDGDRWIGATEFFRGIFTTDLRDDEVIVEIEVPPLAEGTGWAFEEFSRRKGDFALLGVAVLIKLGSDGRCEDARLVYLNAADRPFTSMRAPGELIGKAPDPELINQSAKVASEEINPTGNIHATTAYLRHLAEVLTRRALLRAVEAIPH